MYTRADERFEAYEEPEQSANNDNEQGIINGLHDSFESDYVNVKNKYAEWSGDHVLMLDLRDQETASSFKSAIGSEHYGAEREWFASSVSFHNPSEHTVDGRRKDMEMHIVHYPDPDTFEGDPTLGNEIFAAVIGVLFTTNKDEAAPISNAAQATLETFYESLNNWGPDVDWVIPLKSLMEILDMENKWTYVGSFTTPPCTTLVYW